MKGFVKRTTDITLTTATIKIPWEAASLDATYSGANPTRLTIPSGMTKALIFFTLSSITSGSSSRDFEFTLFKNGVSTNRLYLLDNDPSASVGLCWGQFTVTAGDYFEVQARAYGGSSNALTAAFCTFGFADPDTLAGAAVASLSANTALTSSFAALTWATPQVDNLSTFNGSDGFTVPSGVTAAIVAFHAARTALGLEAQYRLMKNGTSVRRYNSPNDRWAPGPPTFGLIDVTAGDVLKIEAYGGPGGPGTLSAALTGVAIEWLA